MSHAKAHNALSARSSDLSLPRITPAPMARRELESGPEPEGCEAACAGHADSTVAEFYWSALLVHTTITAATVVQIYNDRTGKYRITTIYNTDLGGYTIPTNTNAAGTQVYTVTQSLKKYGTTTTYTIAYPTPWLDYPDYFYWNGTIPTSTNGQLTCLVEPTNVIQYLDPYTPVVATPTPGAAGTYDPVGWTYTVVGSSLNAANGFPAYLNDNSTGPGRWGGPLGAYPDVAALHECDFDTTIAVPGEVAMETAKFVTVTSTSHELGLAPAAKETPSASPTETFISRAVEAASLAATPSEPEMQRMKPTVASVTPVAPVKSPTNAVSVESPTPAAPPKSHTEAAPSESHIQATPVKSPTPATPAESPPPEAPSKSHTQAAPVKSPTQAVPVESPPLEVPSRSHTQAGPLESQMSVVSIESHIQAGPSESHIPVVSKGSHIQARPAETPTQAAPVENHIETLSMGSTTQAAPVESPTQAPPINSPTQVVSMNSPTQALSTKRPTQAISIYSTTQEVPVESLEQATSVDIPTTSTNTQVVTQIDTQTPPGSSITQGLEPAPMIEISTSPAESPLFSSDARSLTNSSSRWPLTFLPALLMAATILICT